MKRFSIGIAAATATLFPHAAQAARIVDVTAFYQVESVLINCGPPSAFCNDTKWYSYPSGTFSFDLDAMTLNEILTKTYTTSALSYSVTVQKAKIDVLAALGGTYVHNYKLDGQVGDYVGSGKAFGYKIVGNAVPEPGSWMLMIVGFGAAGFMMRRRQVATKTSFAA